MTLNKASGTLSHKMHDDLPDPDANQRQEYDHPHEEGQVLAAHKRAYGEDGILADEARKGPDIEC